MNKEERRKGGLDTLIEAHCRSVQRGEKRETEQETQNEYKKINKSNIMYKINYP